MTDDLENRLSAIENRLARIMRELARLALKVELLDREQEPKHEPID